MGNRRRTRVAAAGALPLAVLLGSTLLGAPSASAAKPPGDNGDVKIREVVDGEVSTEKHEHADDPKVCDFLIEAFNYDADTELIWDIVKGPGFKGEPVEEGTFTVDDKGFGRSDPITDLTDGQYKLNVTFDGARSNDEKHKVFKIDCPDEEEAEETGGGGGDPEPTGDEPMGEEPAGEEPAGEEPAGEEPMGEEPAAAEEPADEVETAAEQAPQDDSGVAGESLPEEIADDAGPAAAGAVDAGGGGMSGPTALPALLVGGSLLTLGAVAARRARARG
jgi:hypothetical protein